MSEDRHVIEVEVPEGMPVVDAVVVIRYVDEDGDDCFRIVEHNEPGSIVVLGLLRSAVALREKQIEGFDYDK